MGASAFAQRPKAPVVVSLGDLLKNYGLDTAIVNDTAAAVDYLEAQPTDYVALTNLCVSIRTKAQSALASLENDYTFRDSLLWLDSNTVVADYPIYEYRLRSLADFMGRKSIFYSRLEQQRVEAEKEAARLRAIEEARRQQEARDRMAADLKENIDRHHRAIIAACDGAGVTDKAKLKELKDLYYSYLMVYNKYDLSATKASDESNAKLDELNAFQNDLLENVLGNNSLVSQIDGFKAQLKLRCDKDNSDIYRSYSRVFKRTNVPVAFADITEYQDYINKLHTVINVQNRYLQTLDLRATIAQGNDAIIKLYGKKYRDVVSSYKDVLRTVNQLPTFTTNAESLNFIQDLEDFIAAQQIYLDDYSLLEDLSRRSDTIINGRDSKFRDVVTAYRDLVPPLIPLPTFKNADGARVYEGQLAEISQLQQLYMDVISLRHRIARCDDSIAATRKLDRTLTKGYRLLSKMADLKPAFSTLERGHSFIGILNSHLEMQRLCLATVQKIKTIQQNADFITSKENPYHNISKAYQRMEKAYQGVDEITNTEDLRRYARQCDYILEMQEAFIKLMRSPLAEDSDRNLKREKDISKIRTIIGLE